MAHNTDLPKPWETISSKYVVDDRWMRLRADTCLTSDGTEIGPWYVIEYTDWFDALVIDESDHVILLDHWRQGVGAFVREIVGGRVDANESPDAACRREIAEETGYAGGHLFDLGATYANPSMQNNRVYSYLVVGGSFTARPKPEVGEDFAMRRVPFDEFVASMLGYAGGPVMQALHLSTVLMAFDFVRAHGAETLQMGRLRQVLETPVRV
jgi:8-oxo-dGTP pyrophosphatase MutT (NUDIX family)